MRAESNPSHKTNSFPLRPYRHLISRQLWTILRYQYWEYPSLHTHFFFSGEACSCNIVKRIMWRFWSVLTSYDSLLGVALQSEHVQIKQ